MSTKNAGRILLTAAVAAIVWTSAAGAEQPQGIAAEDVREAIRRGIAFLQQQQNPVKGTWPEMAGYEGGVTAICTLALLNAGVPAEDPSIQRALTYLRSLGEPTRGSKTYCIALRIMVFCEAEPKQDLPLIQRHVAWLERIQLKAEAFNGSWTYSEVIQRGDKSNSQFALLALHEAERAGVTVDESTWRRAEDYWKREQAPDGSWAYVPDTGPSSGSMTCAGIASLAITSGRLSRGDARVTNEQVQCCGEQEDPTGIQRGLDWLGRNFSVSHNPGSRVEQQGRNWLFYYLYALERVGRMTGRRFIGEHDWYREGAEFLLKQQDRLTGAWRGFAYVETEPSLATAYALLFLSKGRRPVLVAKLKREPDDDWNYHRSDLANLTRHVELKWKKDMTWQIVDLGTAGVDDLLQSPVLFISGRDGLRLSPQQQENLRIYVDNGGFLLVEACCEGQQFDAQFRRLVQEMFPDNPLRLLPPDHPVWYAEEKVDPEYAQPLWGIDACCRTSVVYSPQDLSCLWELASVARGRKYPQSVQRRLDAALATGANILAYATNRELRDKFDVQRVLDDSPEDSAPLRATLQIAKLQHGGGSDDAPAALTNLLRLIEHHVQLPVSLQRELVSPADPQLPDYPVLFAQGRAHSAGLISNGTGCAISRVRRGALCRFHLRQRGLCRLATPGNRADPPRPPLAADTPNPSDVWRGPGRLRSEQRHGAGPPASRGRRLAVGGPAAAHCASAGRHRNRRALRCHLLAPRYKLCSGKPRLAQLQRLHPRRCRTNWRQCRALRTAIDTHGPATATRDVNTMEQPTIRLAQRPRHRRHRHHGRRWPQRLAWLLAAALAVGIAVATYQWGGLLRARFQLRLEQTMRDLPHETADAALPPLCFLMALVIAGALGIAVYKLGRPKGFILAGVNTAVAFLLGAWAVSQTRIPLRGIELQHVQLRDVLYVLSFFTAVMVPLGSYFAWFRASLR